ncbi:MAG: DNA-binding response regulator [Bacteroidetes bacterium 4572_112]|nr:MAG: DNA-binding response regulator [Bacteroidetes bacterium 4572_112]
MSKSIKVIVVDDHELFRKGVIMVLKKMDNVEVIGEAGDGKEFLAMLNSHKPDVVFIDIKMPLMNGIEATTQATKRFPELNIIALSMFGEEEYLHKMINAGAKGFLLKNSSIGEIERAINLVNNGKNCYSDDLLGYFTNKFIDNKPKDDDKIKLTRRELEVLNLVAQGLSNTEIADKLFISKRTVDGHKANLIQKTGSKNIVDLLIYSIKNNIITID